MKKGSLLKRGKLIATVGTIKEFKAVGAKKLQVEFDGAVADEATRNSLTFKRGNSTVTGPIVWDAENKVATITTNSILQEGAYTVSMTGVEDKTINVEAEKAEIQLDESQPVLTGTSSSSKSEGRSNDEAYIYYDVKNQYGESIRDRVTINWSITSCDARRDNKTLGLVVAQRKNDREIFTYNTPLQVTATCIKDNIPYTTTKVLTIGGVQAVHEVEYTGFVKRSLKGSKLSQADILQYVPADFPKERWALLYRAKDQNGHYLEASKDNLSSETEGAKLTFISGDPTYINNDFSDGEIYTDGETEYSSVTVEPGAYIDRASEVKLNAISTKTGQPNEKTYPVGPETEIGKVLKSFKIETPSYVIADGDVNQVLEYTAETVSGKIVKDYKTIVRSSNTLNLTASEGTLTLNEGPDGNAVLTWSDDTKYTSGNPYNMNTNGNIIINDGVDRTVSLTAVVAGSESTTNTTTLPVSDMRRPASIKDVRLGVDDNDMVIAGVDQDVFIAGSLENKLQPGITYTDQYGVDLSTARSGLFWDAAKDDAIRGYSYSIRVKKLSGTHEILNVFQGNTGSSGGSGGSNTDIKDTIGNGYIGSDNAPSSSTTANGDVIDLAYNYNANDNKLVIKHNTSDTDTSVSGEQSIKDVTQSTVRYSLVESEKTGNSRYNDIGKARTESYTIVPIGDVSDFTIEVDAFENKLGITTSLSNDPNGSFGNNPSGGSYNYGGLDPRDAVSSGSAITIDKGIKNVRVKSKYKNGVLTVPFRYIRSAEDNGPWGAKFENTSGSSLTISADNNNENSSYLSAIDTIRANYIKWEELYNVNSARYERKNASKNLLLFISDDPSNPKEVDGKLNGALVEKHITVSDALAEPYKIVWGWASTTPTKTVLDGASLGASVIDQYGTANTDRKILYTISDYKESDDSLRMEGNYQISNNGYGNASIIGAERGDSYTLTATVSNSGITDKVTKVVAPDAYAYITSNQSQQQSRDYELRYDCLGYNR